MGTVKTTVYLDEETVNFLRERGLLISKLAERVAREALEGKPPSAQPKEVESPRRVTIKINEDIYRRLRERGLNLSALIRAKTEELKSVL